MEKRNRRIDLLILVVLSLIPFLWTRGGYMILGHDAGTPISPIPHFLDRLSTWTARYGFGTDQTFAVPGLFIHGMEFVFASMGLPLWLNQSITFSLFFFLIGYSMYYFASTLFPHKRYLPLFAAVFFQINHFTLQAWFIAERTKFTTYIALPIILAFIYKIHQREKKPVKTGVLAGVILTVLNGGGFIPVFGALLVCAPLFSLLILSKSAEKTLFLKNLLIFFGVMIGVFVLLNMYWLVPYASYITTSFASEVSKSGGIEGVLLWASEISRNTSILNLFRLQGIQEWYVNPYHTYAARFLSNKILLLISFIVPFSAFFAVFISRSRERVLIIIVALVGLVSLFFMAGSHPPFGSIYTWMLEHIPGFIAFRTPFYKFAPGLWLSYAILIGYTVDFMISRYEKYHRYGSTIGVIAMIAGVILYSYPILGTKFFTYFSDRSTRVKVPEYVLDYAAYSNSDAFKYRRTLILPPQSYEAFSESTTWGYWSIATMNSLFDTHSYASLNLTNTQEENNLMLDLYHTIDRGDSDWIRKARDLNIDSILLRADMKRESKTSLPFEVYQKAIDQTPLATREKQFGKWTLYSLGEPTVPLTQLYGYYLRNDFRRTKDAFPLDGPIKIASGAAFITNTNTPLPSNLKIATIIAPDCPRCSLQEGPLIVENRDIANLPGSPFYGFKIRSEATIRKSGQRIQDLLRSQLIFTIRRLFEMQKLYAENASPENRLAGWTQYSTDVKILDDILKRYLSTIAEGDEKNKMLVTAWDSVYFQQQELKDTIGKINNLDEGNALLDVYSRFPAVLSLIKSRSVFSTKPLIKEYFIPITDSGRYDIYLENDTANIPATGSGMITFDLDGTPAVAPVASDSKWSKITSATLKQGNRRATLTEEAMTNRFDPSGLLAKKNVTQEADGAIKISFTSNESCIDIPLGVLDAEKYFLSYTIQSDPRDIAIQTFVTSVTKDVPLLPYLGKQYAIPRDRLLRISTDIATGTDHGAYRYRMCNLFDTNDTFTLTLRDIQLNKITIPKIMLVKQHEGYAKPKPMTIKTTQLSSTSYQTSATNLEGQLIMLDQRSDARWNLTRANTQITPVTVNSYANGWFIGKTESQNTPMFITFASQKSLREGAYISIITALIAGIYLLWKR